MGIKRHDIPKMWTAEASITGKFPENQMNEIQELLLLHGAILFRGFDVNTAEKLQSIINLFPGCSISYESGTSPRKRLYKNIYTSTEYPASQTIKLHSELSHALKYPSHIFFCCEIAAEKGGQTPVADNRKILEELPNEIVEAFSSRGLRYIRNLHNGTGAILGKSWQESFETENKLDVESYCKERGVQYKWNSSGGLRLVEERNAIVRHPITGEDIWFNQADQFHPSDLPEDIGLALIEMCGGEPYSMPQYVCFADGCEIEVSMLNTIREISGENMVLFDWEVGDLLVADNLLVSHGRLPFSGPRKIIVGMTN